MSIDHGLSVLAPAESFGLTVEVGDRGSESGFGVLESAQHAKPIDVVTQARAQLEKRPTLFFKFSPSYCRKDAGEVDNRSDKQQVHYAGLSRFWHRFHRWQQLGCWVHISPILPPPAPLQLSPDRFHARIGREPSNGAPPPFQIVVGVEHDRCLAHGPWDPFRKIARPQNAF
jgi:hypothetical protein